MESYIYLLTLLPFIGFLINGILGKKLGNEKLIGTISTLAVLVPFVIALSTLMELIAMPQDSRTIFIKYYEWITAGSFTASISYLIDPLSITMVLIVTGVGTLIHIYSIGYMHGDPAFAKFFAYLNLFIFAMLNLVLADNFLLIFLGWEGVGLCSYFLIGFWYEQKFTGDAAKKAFIVNRIGDFGFMTAMFFIFTYFSTLDVSVFNQKLAAYSVGDPLLLTIALLLFLGATGKSAQIPLFVWLPDAMAGPTPVSALIHAATMVTAGIYLVARTSLLYALSPFAMTVIFATGMLTAIVAAVIALRQNDIKKILAYSTVSQLGFMFMALGTGTFWLAIFHLMTHAFFKGLLFLGSGSVIHGMHHEQDIRNMGGLKSKMKITFITFMIGTLAISGIPPLSGFFSKDEILYTNFIFEGFPPYLLSLITAGMTAYYMFRLVALTFYGKPRYDSSHVHPHESPATMTVPLIILAILTALGGLLGLPHFTGFHNIMKDWHEPVFAKAMEVINSYRPEHVHALSVELVLILVSVAVALTGIIIAFKRFADIKRIPAPTAVSTLLENKLYVDEMYDKVIVNPIEKSSEGFLWKIFDVKIIDGAVNGIARYISNIGFDWRRLQTGIIQDYTTVSVAGVIIILLYLLFI
jgi:NADH-quinone oxidoreductase subunit L